MILINLSDDDGFGNRDINQNDDSNFRPADFPSEPDNFVVTEDEENYRYRSNHFNGTNF